MKFFKNKYSRFAFHRYHQANHNRQCLYRLKNETEPFASITEYRLPQRVGFFYGMKKYDVIVFIL
jgi:hypothetical protein